jgi:hypothetical protein
MIIVSSRKALYCGGIIEVGLTEITYVVDMYEMAPDRTQLRALLVAMMDLRVRGRSSV